MYAKYPFIIQYFENYRTDPAFYFLHLSFAEVQRYSDGTPQLFQRTWFGDGVTGIICMSIHTVLPLGDVELLLRVCGHRSDTRLVKVVTRCKGVS